MNKTLAFKPRTIPSNQKPSLVVICVLFAIVWYVGIGYAMAHARGILDWAILQGYTPPPAIATIAGQDGMTDSARRILYVNQPAVEDKQAFATSCKSVQHEEQTIVLGCYFSNQAGIHVLKVTDTRLSGVEQVTTAHEMLHAAYDRLSSSERKRVDGLLVDYYKHGLHDSRLLDTINAYKQSEPNDVVNEMHSIFGSEVANLPAPLEEYYGQYFSDRSKVVHFAATYEAEFTSRKDRVIAYDTQMDGLKKQIDSNNADLDKRSKQLDTAKANLDSLYASNASAYNTAVPVYNAQIDTYNTELAETKQLITQYNVLVDARNALVLEEQQLVGALSAAGQPAAH